MSRISQKRLHELLTYNMETGEFVWLVNRGTIKAGASAGTYTSNGLGYRQICVDGHVYIAHRLAWLYVYGVWPSHAIDHINGNPSDNRIKNLRNVSLLVNQQNQKKAHRSNRHSKLIGASLSKNKFRARIKINGKDVHLGTFSTQELAHAAYVSAKRIHHEGNTL